MLEDGKILLYTEPDGLTTTTVSLTATLIGQTATRRGQTATQAGSTTKTEGAVVPRSRNWDVMKKIGGSRLLIIYEIQVRRSTKVYKGIQRITFKFTLITDELYRRTTEDLLLKCLDHDQAQIAMGEVHEGICGTHQSAPKMKWLLRRPGFYWPTMITDCFQ
jgi:hypothetical protein